MFKKNYKIAIDGRNGVEQIKVLLDVFNNYGNVLHVYEENIEETATGNIIGTVIVFEVRAKRKRFDRLLKIMKEAGHSLSRIRGYWFM